MMSHVSAVHRQVSICNPLRRQGVNQCYSQLKLGYLPLTLSYLSYANSAGYYGPDHRVGGNKRCFCPSACLSDRRLRSE